MTDALLLDMDVLHNYLRTSDEEHPNFTYCAPGDVDRLDVRGQIVPCGWRSQGYASAVGCLYVCIWVCMADAAQHYRLCQTGI